MRNPTADGLLRGRQRSKRIVDKLLMPYVRQKSSFNLRPRISPNTFKNRRPQLRNPRASKR